MAIDTRNKRASCICLALPFRVLPDPDAAIDEFDQQHLNFLYAGIDIIAPAVSTGSGNRGGFMSSIERGGL